MMTNSLYTVASKPTEADFALSFLRSAERVVHYRIPISICDVVDPNTGDLSGKDIAVDFKNSAEDNLFILVHLAGHCIQWNTSENARRVGLAEHLPQTEREIQEVRDYEMEAARYGLQIINEAGVKGLDGWFTDYSTADLDYLVHFYRTKEKRTVKEFWRPGVQPLLTPLVIPPFEPKAWPKRFAI